MKKIAAYFMLVIMVLSGTGISAFAYTPPYPDTEPAASNRLWEQMPTPFSFENLEKIEKVVCDFNTEMIPNTLSAVFAPDDYWNQADGTIKIPKTDATTSASFVLKYAPETGFKPGELYAFSCCIKADDVNKDDEGNWTAMPRNILACHDANSKWIQQSGDTVDIPESGGWYTVTQYITTTEDTSELHLSALLPTALTGTVYFDDFKLYKFVLDPLETILREPAYKGLIYGDGDGDIVLDIMISENEGLHELGNMSLSVKLLDTDNQIVSQSEVDTLHKTMNFVFSSRGLAEGDYYLQSTLTDKTTGEVISIKEHTLRKRAADYRPDNYVDENGHYVKGEDKTFFKRICNGKDTDGDNYVASAEFAKATGIETVSNYATWWQHANLYDKPEDENSILDQIRNLGITSHVSLNSFWYSKKTTSSNGANKLIDEQTDIPGLFAAIANDYKNDAILEGYYLFDEVDAYRYGEEIRWNNQILAEVDIDHPTFGVTDEVNDTYSNFTKMADIVGVDPYPVTGKIDDGQSTDVLSRVGKAVRRMKEKSPNRPVYCVLQGFHYDDRGDLRSPNYAELKNMAWQAICEGAEGLDWYSYHEMKNDSTKNLEQWTSEVTTLLAEVKQYETMILSDEPAPNYTVPADLDWLNITVRRYNGKTYLFAVNNTFNEQQTTVSIEGLEPMDLSFEPLEVKQLALTQEAYLSPEAELISMGFSNGNHIFAVSESDENTLYVPAGSGVINYTADISEGATLYIGGREMPEKGKIAVDHCDRFSVTVLAADGKAKTTKYYNVAK